MMYKSKDCLKYEIFRSILSILFDNVNLGCLSIYSKWYFEIDMEALKMNCVMFDFLSAPIPYYVALIRTR